MVNVTEDTVQKQPRIRVTGMPGKHVAGPIEKINEYVSAVYPPTPHSGSSMILTQARSPQRMAGWSNWDTKRTTHSTPATASTSPAIH